MTADELQQKISDASAAGGDEVVLPIGEIVLNKTVWLKSNVFLRAKVPHMTTITGLNQDYRLLATELSGTEKDLYKNIFLNGIIFKSKRGSAVIINNTTNVEVEKCEFYFEDTLLMRQTLFLQHCNRVEIANNYVHDYVVNGISVTGTDNFNIHDNLIIGNSVSDDGIDVDFDFLHTSSVPSRGGRVYANTVKNVRKGNGIRVENSHNVQVNSNSVEGVTTVGGIAGGILINASATNTASSISIIGNHVTNCTSGGILAEGAGLSGVRIAHNSIKNCGWTGGTNPRAGILLGSPEVECVDNTIRETQNSSLDGGGILVFRHDGHRIQQNTIADSYVGLRYWQGDNKFGYSDIAEADNIFRNNTHDVIRP